MPGQAVQRAFQQDLRSCASGGRGLAAGLPKTILPEAWNWRRHAAICAPATASPPAAAARSVRTACPGVADGADDAELGADGDRARALPASAAAPALVAGHTDADRPNRGGSDERAERGALLSGLPVRTRGGSWLSAGEVRDSRGALCFVVERGWARGGYARALEPGHPEGHRVPSPLPGRCCGCCGQRARSESTERRTERRGWT